MLQDKKFLKVFEPDGGLISKWAYVYEDGSFQVHTGPCHAIFQSQLAGGYTEGIFHIPNRDKVKYFVTGGKMRKYYQPNQMEDFGLDGEKGKGILSGIKLMEDLLLSTDSPWRLLQDTPPIPVYHPKEEGCLIGYALDGSLINNLDKRALLYNFCIIARLQNDFPNLYKNISLAVNEGVDIRKAMILAPYISLGAKSKLTLNNGQGWHGGHQPFVADYLSVSRLYHGNPVIGPTVRVSMSSLSWERKKDELPISGRIETTTFKPTRFSKIATNESKSFYEAVEGVFKDV